MTALPPIDRHQVERFWQRAIAAGAVDPLAPVPSVVEPFGDSQELANELIALVVDGPKRATAGALADFERDAVVLPVPSGLSIATDGHGTPRAVLRTTDVRVGPLSSVGRYPSPGTKARVTAPANPGSTITRRTFVGTCHTIGLEFDHDMATVFERYDVLYTE